MIEVLAVGPATTVQDLGRPGYAAWGLGGGGAADRESLRLANRLVGNPEDLAALEVFLGGLTLRFTAAALVAVTGAPAPVWLDGVRPGRSDGPQSVPAGSVLELRMPRQEVRSYLAVRGGLDTEEILGSRSVDESSGIGRAVRTGDTIRVGTRTAAPSEHHALVDCAPRPARPAGPLTLHGTLGPRHDWFTSAALTRLATQRYTVQPGSDRVGIRLDGPPLERSTRAELLSEPTVRGAVEVPGDGRPIVFGADHPTTCGYPVVAVLDSRSADLSSQCRPGEVVTFRLRRPEIRLTSTPKRPGGTPA